MEGSGLLVGFLATAAGGTETCGTSVDESTTTILRVVGRVNTASITGAIVTSSDLLILRHSSRDAHVDGDATNSFRNDAYRDRKSAFSVLSSAI
jgi:hypothetical protein